MGLFYFQIFGPEAKALISLVRDWGFSFMLPPKAIKEFKDLYTKQFGIELDDATAAAQANNLVALYSIVYGDTLERPAHIEPSATAI